MRRALPLLTLLLITAPLAAKDSLGVFGEWGAFRDAEVPRCYAIASAEDSNAARDLQPFASIGSWPERQVRSQVHFRLSRRTRDGRDINLVVGGERFTLTGDDSDAWANDADMDAAIITAMRAASQMSISASDGQGRRFTDEYALEGAATAIDAATVACNQAS